MSSFVKRYQALYRLQDEVIQFIKAELEDFYLTGGTALDRYYLHHRFSEDLDFFTHNSSDFASKLSVIQHKLNDRFELDDALSLYTESFARFYIIGHPGLKLEFICETAKQWGVSNHFEGLSIDNPGNILANKLCCIMGRDEPKDVFDIVSLAEAYSFNWQQVFRQTASKQIVDETDIVIRISQFPVEWLNGVQWQRSEISITDIKHKLSIIAKDFLLAKDNSLGCGKPHIIEARIEHS